MTRRDVGSRIELRRAALTDRDDMLRITRDVWNGTDYLPYLWDRWVADPRGYLCVATMDGRVVGLQHVDVQDDGTAWLEGIRVDEAMQGRGVGRALLHHGLGWARGAGCPVARLSTSAANEASNRIASAGGFTRLATLHAMSAPACEESGGVPGIRPAHPSERDNVLRVIHDTQMGRATSGFYTEGWTAYRLTPERLALLLGTHAVIVYEQDGLEAVGVATTSIRRPVLRLGLLCGSIEGMQAIVRWIKDRGRAAEIESVRATLELQDGEVEMLHRLGFAPVGGHAMVIWERAL